MSTESRAGTLSPRQAALAAVEARAKQQALDETRPSDARTSHSPTAPFNPSAADKMPFNRLVDTELVPKTSKPQLVKTLDTLLTITNNILAPPIPANATKYRQLRLANKGIQQHIVNVAGAYDYLVASGFRSSTVNFESYLTFAPSPTPKLLHALRCGNLVLQTHLERAKAAEDREKRFRESETEAEKARVARALLGFEEDRRLKREKDDRERISREARAQREREAAAALPAPEEPDNPLFHGPSDASTMRVGPGEEDEDDDVDPPPSYGALHGRVLGTGQPASNTHPPGHVSFVAAQDEEDSENEEMHDEEE